MDLKPGNHTFRIISLLKSATDQPLGAVVEIDGMPERYTIPFGATPPPAPPPTPPSPAPSALIHIGENFGGAWKPLCKAAFAQGERFVDYRGPWTYLTPDCEECFKIYDETA